MIHDRANWRMTPRLAAMALTTAALAFASFDSSEVHAQGFVRSPNINIGVRIDPNIADRAVIGAGRTTTDLRPACSYAYRDSNGGCSDQPVSSADGGGGSAAKNKSNGPRRNVVQAGPELRAVAGEIVAEID